MGSIFNWIDQTESGIQAIVDPSGNQQPGRPYLRFFGNCTVEDNSVTNSTDVTITVDLSSATPLATPNTIVLRDGIGGAAFGPLSCTALSATTITASGTSTLATVNATSLNIINGATTEISLSSNGTNAKIESFRIFTIGTMDAATGFPSRAVTLKSGNASSSGASTGALSVLTGDGQAASGSMLLQTGTGSISTGTIQITTGNNSHVSNSSGFLTLKTGDGASTGNINVQTGNAGTGVSGSFNVAIGSGATTGNINLSIPGTSGTTGNIVCSIGRQANPFKQGNFAITASDITPNYVGGRGVFYQAPCQVAPGTDPLLVGGITYFDSAGNYWVRTKKGSFQLY